MKKEWSSLTQHDEWYVFAYRLTHSQNEAADMCGVSRETIARACRSAGIALDGRKLNTGRNNGMLKATDAQILADIDTGLHRTEIARKYGMNVVSVDKRMKRLGRYAIPKSTNFAFAGIPVKGGDHPSYIFGECWHYVDTHANMVIQKQNGFEYIESRRKKNKSAQIRLKCRCCGNIIERSDSTLRTYLTNCDYCKAREKEKQELTQKRIEWMRFLIALREEKTPKKCKICGEEFYSVYPTKIYCSDKCRRKARESRVNKSIRRRCHGYGVFYDNTITNDAVFMRDGYVCQICGKPCDTTDKSWGHCGPMSPSVDHIIPLVSGGTHTWDNVQCAHVICNSYKRDQVVG